MSRASFAASLVVLAAAIGCSSDSSGPPLMGEKPNLVIIDGDGQSAVPGTAVTHALVVQASSPEGTPLVGWVVKWTVSGGGQIQPSTPATNAAGRAQATWTLGSSGAQEAQVSVYYQSGSGLVPVSAKFSATLTPLAPPPVVPAAVTSISAWPDTNVIFTGMTRTLSLSVVRGSVTGSEPAQSWSTSDPSVATVDNGIVTAVGSGHATITALLEGHVSPPIEVFVLAAPSPALSFATVSNTCGLTTDGLLYCWASPADLSHPGVFPGMPGPFDRCRDVVMFVTTFYRCSEIPRLVSADLHFKFLAGIVSGGCAVTVDGAVYCWGGNGKGELGLGFTDNVTHGLTRVPTDDQFVEVTGGGTRCGRRIDGVILCWGSNSRGDAGIGSPDVSYTSAVVTPTPIKTSVRFTKLSTNCGLATDSTAYCWGSFVGDTVLAGCNTACSLSPVQVNSEKLVELGTGVGYCGIGVSGRAYCWGFHVDSPYRYAEPQEIPNPGFRSFDTALYTVDGSGAAFKIDQYGALWRFNPLNTGELRYKKYFGDCGIALDDKLYCGTQYGPHGKLMPGQ